MLLHSSATTLARGTVLRKDTSSQALECGLEEKVGRPKGHAEDTWGQRGFPTMFLPCSTENTKHGEQCQDVLSLGEASFTVKCPGPFTSVQI